MYGSIRGRIAAHRINCASFTDDEPPLLGKDNGAAVRTSVNSDERERAEMEVTLEPATGSLVAVAGASASMATIIFYPALMLMVVVTICLLNVNKHMLEVVLLDTCPMLTQRDV